MSKIIFCNNEITKIIYSGYTITKAYACGGELVYSGSSSGGTSDMPNDLWKVKFEYENGEKMYIVKGNNTSAQTSDYSNYVSYYENGNIVHNYESYYLNKNNIVTVTFNKNTTFIGNGFISGSTSLKNVYVQNCESPTNIGANAFDYCTALTEVLLCNTVQTIGAESFRHTSSLKDIFIPSSVANINVLAFANSGLLSVRMGGTTPPRLGAMVFEDAPLIGIEVPASAVETYKTASGWSNYASIIHS